MKLRKPKKVMLTGKGAHAIVTWLYGKTEVEMKDFTDEDIAFAQAMLVKLLNQSFEAGVTDELRKEAARMSPGHQKAIATFLKTGGKNLVEYPDKDQLKDMIKDPVVTKSNKNVMARYCASKWASREKSGEIGY